MKKPIFDVLKYFQLFNYPPTFKEIYDFLPKKTTKKALKEELDYLIKKKLIERYKLKRENYYRYTGGEYYRKIKNQKSKIKKKNQKSKIKNQKLKIKTKKKNNLVRGEFNDFEKRYYASEKKLNHWRFRLYIKLLSFFPQIKLVGLSGSLAMMNAKEEDDIDLFIITAKNRLWTSRFIALILSQLLFLRKRSLWGLFMKIIFSQEKWGIKKNNEAICLNLFFDEKDFTVTDYKKTEYIAHEVLQMRPLINKDGAYQRFLMANQWVGKFFPNALNADLKLKVEKSQVKLPGQNFKFAAVILNVIAEVAEKILNAFQMYFINQHKTTELITENQLWFHPEDFGRKVARFLKYTLD